MVPNIYILTWGTRGFIQNPRLFRFLDISSPLTNIMWKFHTFDIKGMFGHQTELFCSDHKAAEYLTKPMEEVLLKYICNIVFPDPEFSMMTSSVTSSPLKYEPKSNNDTPLKHMKGLLWNLFLWAGNSPWWKNRIGIKPSAVTWPTWTQWIFGILLTQHFTPSKCKNDVFVHIWILCIEIRVKTYFYDFSDSLRFLWKLRPKSHGDFLRSCDTSFRLARAWRWKIPRPNHIILLAATFILKT